MLKKLSSQRWSALAALLTLLVSACGSPDGGTNPDPSFTLALSTNTVAIVAGGTANVTVTITRTGGFDDAVLVAVEGLPLGVTAGTLTIGANSSSGVLTLTAAAGVVAGISDLTIRGTASGFTPRTAPLELNVNLVATPDFSVALGAPNLSVAAGATAQVQVTVTRSGGFDGAVALTTIGLPAGVTATFAPISIPAGSTSSTLTLTAGAGAAVTTTNVTVQGTATGVGQRTATLSLEITSAPVGSGDITWTFCGLTGIPVWLAVQDGNGAWTRVTGDNGEFEFDIDADRGGVAYVIEEQGTSSSLNVFYGTRAEIPNFGGDLCGGAEGAGKTVTASVTGLQPDGGGVASEAAQVTLGGVLANSIPSQSNPNITFEGVPDGPVDLLAGLTVFSFSGTGISYTPTKFIARRGLNPAPGSALAPIDFEGPEVFAPVQNSLTLNGVAGGDISFVFTGLRTANGFSSALAQSTATTSWYSFPANRLVAGDLHMIIANATSLQSGVSRTAIRFEAEPQSVTLDLGPGLTPPAVESLAGVGHARARASYSIQQDYDRYWLASFTQTQAANFRSATIQMTREYRESGTGTVVLEIPELSGVAGWMSAWGLAPGAETNWFFSGTGWSDAGGIIQAPFTDGAEYNSATYVGTFTP